MKYFQRLPETTYTFQLNLLDALVNFQGVNLAKIKVEIKELQHDFPTYATYCNLDSMQQIRLGICYSYITTGVEYLSY